MKETVPQDVIRDDLSYFNDHGHPVLFLTLTRPLYDHYVRQICPGPRELRESFCSICHEEFIDDDYLREVLLCHHLFHESCLEYWLSKCESCPLCGSVLEREYLRVMRPKVDHLKEQPE